MLFVTRSTATGFVPRLHLIAGVCGQVGVTWKHPLQEIDPNGRILNFRTLHSARDLTGVFLTTQQMWRCKIRHQRDKSEPVWLSSCVLLFLKLPQISPESSSLWTTVRKSWLQVTENFRFLKSQKKENQILKKQCLRAKKSTGMWNLWLSSLQNVLSVNCQGWRYCDLPLPLVSWVSSTWNSQPL